MSKQAAEKSRSRTMILTGNQAAGWGAFLGKVQVASAYPITPQTTVIETLAELMTKATWPSKFVNVESEHSALSVCIGASITGVRTYTATSAQGLALMHELLHWASGSRLPIVLVNVNRAMAPGWSIWTDQNDSLSQRDTGWAQFYCSSVQEVLDHVIIGFRLAEHLDVPVMVVEDAFVLSHTAEAIEVPAEEVVDEFLPPRVPSFRLDTEEPSAFGGLLLPDYYQEVRQKLHDALFEMDTLIPTVYSDWERATGRAYAPIETYGMEDADVALLVSGAAASTTREVVQNLRDQGKRVGMVQVRLFRPFPTERLRTILSGVPRVAVMDRNCSYGHHGIFFQELKSALYSLKTNVRPQLFGYIVGLGGRDISPGDIREVVRLTEEREHPEPETLWLGATLPSATEGRPVATAEEKR